MYTPTYNRSCSRPQRGAGLPLRDWSGISPFVQAFRRPIFTQPQVNIVKSATGFVLELAVPGLSREHFSLKLEDQTLIVSAKVEERDGESTDRFTHREFRYGTFIRSFALPENADSERIGATYEAGILSVSIPYITTEQPVKREIRVN